MRFIRLSLASIFLMSGCATVPTGPAIEGAGDTVVAANTLFASDFLEQLETTEAGNIFVSPLSLSTAMGMLQAGAAGETKAEIDRVFRYPESEFYAELGALRKSASRVMESDSPDLGDTQITSIANSVWVDRSARLKSEYTRILRDEFEAVPTPLDFENRPDAARETINDWVEDKTNDRIKDLLKKNNVGRDTSLVLVNTVYMMSHWRDVFWEENTKSVPFHVDGEAAEPRQLMHQTKDYQRLKVDGGEALKIPYANQTSMIILLPKGKRGLDSANAMMRQNVITQALDGIDEAPSVSTDLALPKFRLEARYELNEALQNMGLRSIFSLGANFSRMSDDTRLSVGNVLQQVFLDVNEKGTEAAAATAITVVIVSARQNPPKPKPFIVDRPFVVLIRDDVTGAVMFAGRITNPKDAG